MRSAPPLLRLNFFQTTRNRSAIVVCVRTSKHGENIGHFFALFVIHYVEAVSAGHACAAKCERNIRVVFARYRFTQDIVDACRVLGVVVEVTFDGTFQFAILYRVGVDARASFQLKIGSLNGSDCKKTGKDEGEEKAHVVPIG